jgi:type IV pilus assembly protein PilY1
MRKRESSLILSAATFILLAFAEARATPTDASTFLTIKGGQPNIMLLIDSSGSMRDRPQGCSSCAAKWDILKQVVKDLVLSLNPPDGAGGYTQKARLGLSQFSNKGGARLLAPIADNNTAALLSALSAARNSSGGTPLGTSLADMARYFAGDRGWGTLPTFGPSFDSIEPKVASPIDVWCRQNFIIALSDGLAKDDDIDKYGGSTFCDTIGDADRDSVEDGCGSSGGSDEDWMDDVAHVLYRTDFAPKLLGTQNITVHTIGFDIDAQILRDAADNGGGTYHTSGAADQLLQAFLTAAQNIFDGLVAFSATTVPTSRTAYGDGFFNAFFHAKEDEAFWSGHLEAYRLSPSLEVLDKDGNPALHPSTGEFLEPRQPFWDLQERLLASGHPPRSIFTTKADSRTNFATWTITASDLDLQASELGLYPNDANAPFADTEALADALVDYLYGQDTFDEDRDGDSSELREAILGDIFHSKPRVIGPPSVAMSGEPGFGPPHDPTSFLAQYGHRDRRIYVGANDGMLHAVNAGQFQPGDNLATPESENGYYDLGNGNEEFAYIPGLLLDTLKFIPRNIPRTHDYVDGSLSAADVWLPSSPSDPSKEPSEWATVLVTGMRRGASGYLALDVTDPDATTGPHGPYPKLLWEIDEADVPLGETWSEPIITRVKIKAGSTDLCGRSDQDDGACREQWVAIFAGGYRSDGNPNLSSYVPDPNSAAWTNRSKGIFMVAMDTGKLIGQVLFDPDPSELLNQMRFSLPSTPAVLDLDFDGFTDVVYVGDLGGQVWRWDVSAVGEDQSTPNDGIMDSWPVGLFFKSDPATLAGGGLHYHSIFFPPVATYLNGELVLAFGSGERTDMTYEGNTADDDNNRFWVVWDRVLLGVDPSDPNSGWLTIGEGHATVNGVTHGLNDVTNLATDPAPDDDGYFIKVPDGEKFVTNHILIGGILLTLSYVPDNSSTGQCNPVGLTNIWAFNLENGGGLLDETAAAGNDQRKRYLGPGAPSDPSITISEDKVVLIGRTSQGSVFEFDVPVTPPPPVELIFWRQRF